MAVKIAYNNSKIPKDTLVSINGLCEVPNGGSVEVDDESLAFFEKEHGKNIATVFKNSKLVTITGQAVQKDKEDSSPTPTEKGVKDA